MKETFYTATRKSYHHPRAEIGVFFGYETNPIYVGDIVYLKKKGGFYFRLCTRNPEWDAKTSTKEELFKWRLIGPIKSLKGADAFLKIKSNWIHKKYPERCEVPFDEVHSYAHVVKGVPLKNVESIWDSKLSNKSALTFTTKKVVVVRAEVLEHFRATYKKHLNPTTYLAVKTELKKLLTDFSDYDFQYEMIGSLVSTCFTSYCENGKVLTTIKYYFKKPTFSPKQTNTNEKTKRKGKST